MFQKNKQKLKREDFIFENGWFEELVRMPGTMHMQQFQISDCEECQIYLFDANATVLMDDCKYCTLFIGPSQSSIFIRDCHYLNVVCMSQQFRMRDCTYCRIWLWCESRPIIQSSHDIVFSAYPQSIGYQPILTQLKQSKLQLWNNNWYDIYDFTPTKYSKQNYKLTQTLPQEQKLIQKYHAVIRRLKLQYKSSVVPFCAGTMQCTGEAGMQYYSVIVVLPIPVSAVGLLPVLQSRVGRIVDQHKNYVQGKYIGCSALFIKIKAREVDKWKSLGEKKCSIIGVIADNKGKQQLQSTVFMPFEDQR